MPLCGKACQHPTKVCLKIKNEDTKSLAFCFDLSNQTERKNIVQLVKANYDNFNELDDEVIDHLLNAQLPDLDF